MNYYLIYRTIFSILLVLFLSPVAMAQFGSGGGFLDPGGGSGGPSISITGPSQVMAGTSYTYSVAASNTNITWDCQGCTFVSPSPTPLTGSWPNQVQVKWQEGVTTKLTVSAGSFLSSVQDELSPTVSCPSTLIAPMPTLAAIQQVANPCIGQIELSTSFADPNWIYYWHSLGSGNNNLE
ncbi:MAG: hypothetical protein ACPGJS_07265, partial [Flammeovirgaceae bacterium]